MREIKENTYEQVLDLVKKINKENGVSGTPKDYYDLMGIIPEGFVFDLGTLIENAFGSPDFLNSYHMHRKEDGSLYYDNTIGKDKLRNYEKRPTLDSLTKGEHEAFYDDLTVFSGTSGYDAFFAMAVERGDIQMPKLGQLRAQITIDFLKENSVLGGILAQMRKEPDCHNLEGAMLGIVFAVYNGLKELVDEGLMNPRYESDLKNPERFLNEKVYPQAEIFARLYKNLANGYDGEKKKAVLQSKRRRNGGFSIWDRFVGMSFANISALKEGRGVNALTRLMAQAYSGVIIDDYMGYSHEQRPETKLKLNKVLDEWSIHFNQLVDVSYNQQIDLYNARPDLKYNAYASPLYDLLRQKAWSIGERKTTEFMGRNGRRKTTEEAKDAIEVVNSALGRSKDGIEEAIELIETFKDKEKTPEHIRWKDTLLSWGLSGAGLAISHFAFPSTAKALDVLWGIVPQSLVLYGQNLKNEHISWDKRYNEVRKTGALLLAGLIGLSAPSATAVWRAHEEKKKYSTHQDTPRTQREKATIAFQNALKQGKSGGASSPLTTQPNQKVR